MGGWQDKTGGSLGSDGQYHSRWACWNPWRVHWLIQPGLVAACQGPPGSGRPHQGPWVHLSHQGEGAGVPLQAPRHAAQGLALLPCPSPPRSCPAAGRSGHSPGSRLPKAECLDHPASSHSPAGPLLFSFGGSELIPAADRCRSSSSAGWLDSGRPFAQVRGPQGWLGGQRAAPARGGGGSTLSSYCPKPVLQGCREGPARCRAQSAARAGVPHSLWGRSGEASLGWGRWELRHPKCWGPICSFSPSSHESAVRLCPAFLSPPGLPALPVVGIAGQCTPALVLLYGLPSTVLLAVLCGLGGAGP